MISCFGRVPPGLFFRENRWEDGLLQMDISKKYIHEVIAEDDSSVGKGASLTAEVVEHLAWIGKTVGPIVDQVRKAVHLSSLKKVRAPNNGDGEGGGFKHPDRHGRPVSRVCVGENTGTVLSRRTACICLLISLWERVRGKFTPHVQCAVRTEEAQP